MDKEVQLKEKLRQGGDRARTYAELAALRLAAKDPVGARDNALKGLSRSPGHLGSLVALARAQKALGALIESSEAYRRVVKREGMASGEIISEWEELLRRVGEQAVSRQHVANLEQVVGAMQDEVFQSSETARSSRLKYALALVTIHLRQKNSQRAQASLAKARRLGLDDDKELFVSGQMRASEGKFKESQALFKRWARNDDSPKRWARIANYFRSSYRLKEALWSYREGTERFPKSAMLWRALGTVLVLTHEPTQALQAWTRAAGLSRFATADERVNFYLESALTLRQAGYREQALKMYERAFKLGGSEPRVLQGYADYLLQLGRGQELVSVVKTYVTSLLKDHRVGMPRDDRLRQVLEAVELVKKSGRIQAAVDLIEAAQTRSAPNVDTCLYLAELQEYQSNPRARDKTMERCRKKAEGDVSSLLKVGDAWLRFQLPVQASNLANQILVDRPSNVGATLLGASALYEHGQESKGDSLLKALLKTQNDAPKVVLSVATFYRQQSKLARAEAVLLTSLKNISSRDVRRLHRELVLLYLEPKLWDEEKALVHMRLWMGPKSSEEDLATMRLFRLKMSRFPQAIRLNRILLERLMVLKPDEKKSRFRLGEIQLQLKDFIAARRTFEEALRGSSFSVEAVESVARSFLKAGEHTHSYFFLKMLSPSQIGQDDLLITLGVMFDERSLSKKATQCYEEFLKRASGSKRDPASVEEFGRQMLAQGRHSLAIGAYETLVERKPHPKTALSSLGRAYLGAGRLLAARRAFERHLGQQRGGKVPAALNQVADIYLEFGATKEAARLLEEKLSLERDRWQAPSYARLCSLYREHGDVEAIRRVTKVFLSRGFNPGRAAEIASRELERSGLTRDAVELLRAVLKMGGRKVRNRRVLMRRLIHYGAILGDDAQMLNYARSYATGRGGQKASWIEAAGFLVEEYKYALAVDLLGEGMKIWPNDPTFQVSRGRYLLEMGRKDAAERDFSEALAGAVSIAPTMKEIRRVLGTTSHQRLLARMEKLARAFQPGRVDGYLTLGGVLAASGDLLGAKRAFARYLDKNPRGHLKVARAYGRHQVDEALRHYQSADLKVTNVAVKVLREVASLLIRHGDADRMDVFVRRFLMQTRNPPQGFEAISAIWLNLGKLNEAVRWLERAIERGPNSVRYRKLGKLYFGLRETEKALDAFINYVSALHLRPAGRRASFRETQSYENAVLEVLAFYLDRSSFSDGRRFLTRLDLSSGLSPFLILSRVELMVHEGRVQEALALVAQRAQQLQGVQPRHVERLVRLLSSASLYSEALAVMDYTRTGRTSGNLGRLRLRFLSRLGRTNELELMVAGQVAGASSKTPLDVALLLFVEGEYGLCHRLLKAYLKRGSVGRRAEALHALRKTERLLGVTATEVSLPLGRLGLEKSPFREASERALSHLLGRRYRAALDAAKKALTYEPGNAEMVRIALQASLIVGDEAETKAWVRKRVKFELSRVEPAVKDLKIVRLLRRSYAGELEAYALEVLVQETTFQPKVARRYIRALLRIGETEKSETVATEILFRTGDKQAELSRLVALYLDAGQIEAMSFLLKQEELLQGAKPAERLLTRFRVALYEGQREQAHALGTQLAQMSHASSTIRERAAWANEAYRGPAELTDIFLSLTAFKGRPSESVLRLRARSAWRRGELLRAQESLHTLLERYPPNSSSGLASLVDILRECVWAGDTRGLNTLVSVLETQTAEPLASIVGFVAGLLHDAPSGAPIHTSTECLDAIEALIVRAELLGLDEQQLVSAWSYLAEARDDLDGAVKAQRASRERDGSTPTSMNNLAYLYSRTGKQLEEGLTLVRAAVSQTLPLQPSYSDTEAWLLHKMGRSDAAIVLMKEALHFTDWSRVGYGHSEILFHYAELLRATHHAEKAADVYRDCARYRFKSRYARSCAERLKRSVDPAP